MGGPTRRITVRRGHDGIPDPPPNLTDRERSCWYTAHIMRRTNGHMGLKPQEYLDLLKEVSVYRRRIADGKADQSLDRDGSDDANA